MDYFDCIYAAICVAGGYILGYVVGRIEDAHR